MKKLMLKEDGVKMSVDTRFVASAKQNWDKKKLLNFMPPFLSGVMEFEDGYSFFYQAMGKKDTYPRKIEFYGVSSYAEISGFISVKPDRPYIKCIDVKCTSKHEKHLMNAFVRFAVFVFGEYNYQKQNRETVTRIRILKSEKGDYTKTNSHETVSCHKSNRKAALKSDEVSKPFIIHKTVDEEGNPVSLKAGEYAGRKTQRSYTTELWPCAGYYRRNGVYVEPCIKRRHCLYK